MKSLRLALLILALAGVSPSYAQLIQGGGGGGSGVSIDSGTELPSTCTPATGPSALFYDTDDFTLHYCSETDTFLTISTGQIVTLDIAFAGGKEITGANSVANAVRIGDGTTPICIFTDATKGPWIKPCTDSNTATYILTNFNHLFYDVEGDKNMIVLDPDSIGAGSGTMTMQTSEQFVASNLGIEFNESDTNPACAAGNYNIYADASEATLKKCINGVTTLLSPGRTVTIPFPADSLYPLGSASILTNAAAVSGGLVVPYGTITDSDSDGFYRYHVMPSNWNGGTVTATITVVNVNGTPANNVEFDVSGTCYPAGTVVATTISNTGEQAANIDFDAAGACGGSACNQNDPASATTSAITLNGTPAGGNLCAFQAQVDATATNETVTGIKVLQMDIHYTTTAGS